MLNILLFGAPGAGKGTQSQRLIEKHNLVHISTGDILRAERKAQTPLGKLASEYIDKGALVPDEVIIGIVENKIKQSLPAQGFVFDGFPRTVAQAEALDRMLGANGLSISGMIAMDVPADELKQRLLKRAQLEGRADDTPEVIANRIQVYQNETLPVAGFYRSQNKYHEINGLGSIEDITARVEQVLAKLG